jgi:hypothetical protein
VKRKRSDFYLLLAALLMSGAAELSCHASITHGDRQQLDVQLLARAAEIYFEDFGQYPQTDSSSTWFQKLVKAQIIHPDLLRCGTTPDGALPIDLYEQRIVYEITNPTAAGSAIVRSIGRDGIDNLGAGDDLDSRFGPNIGYWNKAAWPRFFTFIAGGWLIALVAGITAWVLVRRFWVTAFVSLLTAGVLVGFVTSFMFGAGLVHSTATRLPRWGEAIVSYSALGVPLALTIGAIGLAKLLARRRSRRRGNCPECNYDLRGELASGCPECGWNRVETTQ